MLPDTLEVAYCRGLNSQANVAIKVVLHLLGSILWHTFKYFGFFFLRGRGRIKVSLTHVKTWSLSLGDYSY